MKRSAGRFLYSFTVMVFLHHGLIPDVVAEGTRSVLVHELRVIEAEYQNFELRLTLQESSASATSCELILNDQRYLQVLGSLIATVRPQEPCPLEMRSKRKAYLRWRVPLHLRQSSEVDLLVNEKKLGVLKFSASSVEFEKAD